MNIVKLYERLSAEERFKAAVSAAARSDMIEWDRLNDTSPMRQIQVQEPSYFARVQKLWHMSLLHSTTVRKRRLMAAGSICVLLAIADSDHASERESVDEGETMNREEQISAASQRFLAMARGMESAFDAFCLELQLDPQEVRTAFGLDGDELLDEIFDAASVEIDSIVDLREVERSERESWLECLSQFWDRSIHQQFARLDKGFGSARPKN